MQKYKTHGTCSTSISYDIVDGKVTHVHFENGCRGNLQGIAALVEGLPAEEVIARLEGIQCHNGTSCPDQLCKALKAQLNKG
ncbi:MAG: TIGR03905 family TSCPD domain-containing protein [Eubacteriales bacterium]|nr:TIGR03905 family TSCPD domain-containing protein [Eubacteriales bacterium]